MQCTIVTELCTYTATASNDDDDDDDDKNAQSNHCSLTCIKYMIFILHILYDMIHIIYYDTYYMTLYHHQ